MTSRDKQQQFMKRRREQKMRQRKRILIFFVEVLCLFSLVSFLVGRAVGARTEHKKITSNVSSTGVLSNAEEDNDSGDGQESDGVDKSEILLVNKENKLPDDYEVELLTLPDGVNRAAKEAYQPLCDMLKAGQKAGLSFEICSSYRDVERQEELFEEDLRALINQGYSYFQAYEEVAKETMPPGYSEHSTGLAFDIVALDYQMLDEGQARTAENKWLQEHCAEYGFILRYPQGKEDITAISYESWHFRYVGVEAAEYIMEKGITLEEYLAG